MAMRGAVVEEAPSFIANVKALRDRYPRIREAIDEFKQALKLDYVIPMLRVSESTPQVYAQKMDYPPMGSGGRGRFVVVLHATKAAPSMNQPFRTYTLLAISEAPEALN